MVRFKDGIKKGCISQICADSGWGKSMIGYSVLKSAFDSGMDCFIIDTENEYEDYIEPTEKPEWSLD